MLVGFTMIYFSLFLFFYTSINVYIFLRRGGAKRSKYQIFEKTVLYTKIIYVLSPMPCKQSNSRNDFFN